MANWSSQNAFLNFCCTLASVTNLWLQFDHCLTDEAVSQSANSWPNKISFNKSDRWHTTKVFLTLIQVIFTEKKALSFSTTHSTLLSLTGIINIFSITLLSLDNQQNKHQVLISSIQQFPWWKYSHYGRFKATYVMLLYRELGSNAQ